MPAGTEKKNIICEYLVDRGDGGDETGVAAPDCPWNLLRITGSKGKLVHANDPTYSVRLRI